jgi:hypothetical protein
VQAKVSFGVVGGRQYSRPAFMSQALPGHTGTGGGLEDRPVLVVSSKVDWDEGVCEPAGLADMLVVGQEQTRMAVVRAFGHPHSRLFVI